MEAGGAIIIGWIHLVAAVLLVGGPFFLDRIVGPVIELSGIPEAEEIRVQAARRFTNVAWISMVVLIATGILRAWGAGFLNVETLFTEIYGNILLGKTGLVVIMIVNAGALTSTGRKIRRLMEAGTDMKEEIMRSGLRARYLSRMNFTLGLIVLFLSIVLRFVSP